MIRKIIWAVVLIAVGTWIWLAKLGIISRGLSFNRDWPLIIIIIGIITLVEAIIWKRRCCK